MKRAVLLVGLVTFAGCSDPSASGPVGRSEIVTSTAAATAKSTSTANATATAKPRHAPLCSKMISRDMPSVKYEHFEAAGQKPLGDAIETGGTWTWVNLWAAYCGPCREEIPRIQGFADKLAKAGTPIRVAFVSLDDDERQCKQFLDGDALKRTLFVNEKDRSKFLSNLGLEDSVALPVQVFVDPSGTVKCVTSGAIDDSDFAEIEALVSKK